MGLDSWRYSLKDCTKHTYINLSTVLCYLKQKMMCDRVRSEELT